MCTREQLMHLSSIIELISFLQVLLLKMFKVFADVKSEVIFAIT